MFRYENFTIASAQSFAVHGCWVTSVLKFLFVPTFTFTGAMSLHWTLIAGFLYAEIGFVLVLLVPFIDRSEAPSSVAKSVRWILGIAAIAAWAFLALRQYMS